MYSIVLSFTRGQDEISKFLSCGHFGKRVENALSEIFEQKEISIC